MRGCNVAQSPITVLQPDAAPREVLVEFEYSLASEVSVVSPFVDHVMRSITIFRVASDIEVDIEVALREALLNAIIHGNKEDPQKRVYVTIFCAADGEVAMTIRDEGPGFDSSSVPDPTVPEHRMSAHGRGIYLMRALMDEVSFEEGGNVVFMRKRASLDPSRSQGRCD
ncbi:MAG TPA: ATP-binding protein [Dongiaceae bacterium]|nr:ATP-binding protein [Dongiaceae bacterium]